MSVNSYVSVVIFIDYLRSCWMVF